jgi:hypothetical protein
VFALLQPFFLAALAKYVITPNTRCMDATLLIASGQQSHVLVSSKGFMVYRIVGRLSGALCLGEYSTLEYLLESVTNIPFVSASMPDRQLIPAFFSTCSA